MSSQRYKGNKPDSGENERQLMDVRFSGRQLSIILGEINAVPVNDGQSLRDKNAIIREILDNGMTWEGYHKIQDEYQKKRDAAMTKNQAEQLTMSGFKALELENWYYEELDKLIQPYADLDAPADKGGKITDGKTTLTLKRRQLAFITKAFIRDGEEGKGWMGRITFLVEEILDALDEATVHVVQVDANKDQIKDG